MLRRGRDRQASISSARTRRQHADASRPGAGGAADEACRGHPPRGEIAQERLRPAGRDRDEQASGGLRVRQYQLQNPWDARNVSRMLGSFTFSYIRPSK